MKKIVYFLFSFLLVTSCSNESKDVKITVENPSDFDRTTELAEISLDDLKNKIKLVDGQTYEVKNSRGEVISSQITSDGKLIFASGVKAKSTESFTIASGVIQEFKPQTYARFITERKDDFAWENDCVAFRVYGPALIATDGPSNGMDIWYKRTSDLVIDKWYEKDLGGIASYHDDNGEGLDDYKVGPTLGAGAMAPYADRKLWRNENFVSQEILDNGPLRTTFKLIYKDISVNDKSFSESRTISIDAGSQLTKITQEYGTAETLPVAAGLVRHQAGDSIIVSSDNTYIEYLEPKTDKAEGVYLALVFPQGIEEVVEDTYKIVNEATKKEASYSHVLALVSYKPNTPVTYYTGYGWNKFGFKDQTEFQTYLNNFVAAQKEPLKITINN